MGLLEQPAIVIDNGSHNIKAGFSCDNHPISIFSNIVGRPKYLNGCLGKEYYDVYIGNDALGNLNALDLYHPVVKGRIMNWDDMERVWHHIFYKELRMAPEERAVMLADSPAADMMEKKKTSQVFFETLNVPGLCIASQSVLSVYGSGYVSGVCVDLGHDSTDINPVFEGGLIKYAHLRTNIAGKEISEYIKNKLCERGHDYASNFIEDIKRQCCYLAEDPHTKSPIQKRYKLPSGEEIDVTNEAYSAPELLFNPSLMVGANPQSTPRKTVYTGVESEDLPLHTAIVTATMKCDPDLRSLLYEAIIPCGGFASVPGLNDRLKRELEKETGVKMTLTHSSESYCINWLGAAAFSGLNDVSRVWVSKAQYLEEGDRVVEYKFL